MTVPRQASGACPRGLWEQAACVNTILYCEKWADTVAFYKTGLQLPVSVARSRLCRNGLAPTPIKTHPWGANVMYLNDPEGNRLEFWCRLDVDQGG